MHERDDGGALAVALATRFIDPARMSPAAKMPGTVVSRSPAADLAPRLERDVAAGEDEAVRVARDRVGSQSQSGSAPSSRNRPARLAPVPSPVGRASTRATPGGLAAAVDHPEAVLDADPGVELDLADEVRRHGRASVGRRTTIVTERANRARWIAACPAELPPPTTTTSAPSISRAAVIAAP